MPVILTELIKTVHWRAWTGYFPPFVCGGYWCAKKVILVFRSVLVGSFGVCDERGRFLRNVGAHFSTMARMHITLMPDRGFSFFFFFLHSSSSSFFKVQELLLILPAQLLWKFIKVLRPLCHLRERQGEEPCEGGGEGRWKFWHSQKHTAEPLDTDWRATDRQASHCCLFIFRPSLKVGIRDRLRLRLLAEVKTCSGWK